MGVYELLAEAEMRADLSHGVPFDLEGFLLLNGARVEWVRSDACDGWKPSPVRKWVLEPVDGPPGTVRLVMEGTLDMVVSLGAGVPTA